MKNWFLVAFADSYVMYTFTSRLDTRGDPVMIIQ